MAKKSKAKPKEPMYISLSLPVEGNMPRKGTILVRHETTAVLHRFDYRTMRDILTAINDAVNHELVVEADPPQIPALSATPTTATTLPSTATAPDPAAPEEADTDSDPTDEGGEPTDDGGEPFEGNPDAQESDQTAESLFEETADEQTSGDDPADNFAPTGEPISQPTLF